MPFISRPDGDVKNVFITDAWLLDQFVGSTLWTWGANLDGQLGDNTSTSRSSPVQTVSGGTNWKQALAAGQPPSGSDDEHTVAIKNDGTLWTWGCNNQGQLGDNTSTNRSSPIQTVTGGSTWKQVYGGRSFTIAVKNG